MLTVNLIGNIGGDPEMRYTADGRPLLRFNVANNYRERDQAGAWQDRVEWLRVTVLGPRAETLANLLSKGQRVYVSGRLTARPWTDQQGGLRAGLEILAADVEFMSPRTDGSGHGGGADRPSGQPARPRPQPAAVAGDGESDLPF